MALEDHDTAADALLVKAAERQATLLGLNTPLSYAGRVIRHPPEHRPRSTDRIRRRIVSRTAVGLPYAGSDEPVEATMAMKAR
jgi:hypothetical protein